MARFTVHLPKAGAMKERLENAVFVRDGFTFGAFAMGGWWFILNGYLLAAFLLFGAYGVFAAFLAYFGLVSLLFPITFLLAILLGFEAASLQRWTLTRRGFEEVGILSGDAGDALEQRFFAQYLAQNSITVQNSALGSQSLFETASPKSPSNRGTSLSQGDVLGLFPQPIRPYSGSNT